MSEFESPDRTAAGRKVVIEDVRELMGASTPHFALQLRGRIGRLIADLPAIDPARVLGEREMTRLDQLAVGGENRGQAMPNERRIDQNRLPSGAASS